MRNIIVKPLTGTPIEDLDIEIVERKGIGHPDSISDGIAESVSNAFCKIYQDKFGGVLHHNTDEVQITAGESDPKFGGGEIIRPIQILLTGRGVPVFEDEKVAIEKVAIMAAKDYLKENILNLDVESSTVVEAKLGHGSGDLVNVFGRDGIPAANDTSFGVGYAPFSEVENVVFNTENLLNSKDFKKKHPAVGEDIKVMGLREGDKITLTVAIAMVSKFVQDRDTYLSIKEEMKEIIADLAGKYTDREVEVFINTADNDESESEESFFLTVTGTSAEMGDDGSVGRGNRANGLITPNRPMSMEATSGKNPINHVGKIYNILSNRMANDIAENIEGVQQVEVILLSQIGKAIDQPRAAYTRILTEDGYELEDIEGKISRVMDSWLENISDVTEDIVKGNVRTF